MEYKNITIVPRSLQADGRSDRTEPDPEPDHIRTMHVKQENMSDSALLESLHPREGARYRYIRTIGRGGMKVVLEVHDNDTMRNVAMALLPDISTRSPLEQGQFLREARITAELEHPNIVPVHDIGMDSSGSPYFTMKLLRGRTLATVLKKLEENDPEYVEKYTFDHLMRIYSRICNAIAFAHSRGVLHLDLKPENVQIGDYGEVLVLDWGLARKIVPSEGGDPKIGTKTQKMKPLGGRVRDEQVNGTPGYMAPEQIGDGRHSCSPQTDIYSLGAILYAMITYKDPLRDAKIDQMLRDTLAGNIVRPSKRAAGRSIPYGIEAVVLKAMSLDPMNRYATVLELRDEVIHFLDGYATAAEKAGPIKKSLLFTRRHWRSLTTGAVILMLTLMLGFFSWREAHRIISLWVPVLSANFLKPGFPMDACSFRDLDFKEIDRGWKLDESGGLRPERNQWLVFREALPENLRITLNFRFPRKKMKMLEIALIPASTGDGPKPPTVSARLIRHPHLLAEILEKRNEHAPRILASARLPNWKKDKATFSLVYENGFISFAVDRKIILKTAFRQVFGGEPVLAAFMADMPGATLEKLEISRLAPPENTTALLAGDTLAEERLYEPAIRRYLQVDDNRPGSKLAERALQKAYLAAFKLESAELRSEFMLDIKKRLAASYPGFNLSRLLAADACNAWSRRDYTLAVTLMRQALERDPASQTISSIMELPHEPLPPEIRSMLMKLIRRTQGLTSLDLSNYGLTSLQEIAGMKLISLNCSGNKLVSLQGLEGMPLESLDCSNNQIVSLKELGRMPLRYLDCSGNRIRDFSPLKKLSLRRCRVSGNPAAGTAKRKKP